MYNLSYPNFNNSAFCYNNQVIQNSKNTSKANRQSFGENVQSKTSTTQNTNHKTVYVPTTTPNGNASGVNIIIYNPAVVPGNNTTFNNNYTQSPTLNTNNKEQGESPQMQQNLEDENLTQNENLYNDLTQNEDPNNGGLSENQELNQVSDEDKNNMFNQNASNDEVKEKETKTKTKEVTLLTDEYIKTLENYLRNENKDIRKQGMDMLSKCFREDKSRYDDEALNNLLNLALQDIEPGIRILAMCVLDTKDAKGDDLTYDILTQLQNSTAYGGEEAKMAAKILLEFNTQKVTVTQHDMEVNNGE